VQRLALLAAALAALGAPADAEARRGGARSGAAGNVELDGARVRVRWNDGDSFRIEDGPFRGARARLEGVNALETFGPVHAWGTWRPDELLAIARGSAAIAAADVRRCAARGATDRYGRLLVACPDAARGLVAAGHAMVFALDAPPDPALLEVQRAAQAAGAGMWAKGVPPEIPSSVHARGERGLGARGAYDRIVDTRTGIARARSHDRVYGTCENVCVGPPGARACLVYVPYERRYRDRPACLRPR
jgi:endonuclease YncB( thermonuclease family)